MSGVGMATSSDDGTPGVSGNQDDVVDNSSAGDTSAYQRNCAVCGTWLEYRREGPVGAFAIYSFCPNRECSAFGEAVQDVHVS